MSFTFSTKTKISNPVIPVWAFTGSNYLAGWSSIKANSRTELKSLVDRICASRELNIAIPRVYVPFFSYGLEFEHLDIFASDKPGAAAYEYNLTVRFDDVAPTKSAPIHIFQNNQLNLNQEFVKYYTKILGPKEILAAVAVTLFVSNASGDVF